MKLGFKSRTDIQPLPVLPVHKEVCFHTVQAFKIISYDYPHVLSAVMTRNTKSVKSMNIKRKA